MKNKSKLKISEYDFKNYLLDHYVDDEGNKISDRVIWSSEEFYDYTGMFSVNKFTKIRQPVSTGTISYWKNKLDLKEEDIFSFHQEVTKKIKDNISFEEWSRKNNKGYKKDKSTYNRDVIKNKLIKHVGLPNKYTHMSLDNVSNLALKIWSTLGLNAEEEMKKFYEEVM